MSKSPHAAPRLFSDAAERALRELCLWRLLPMILLSVAVLLLIFLGTAAFPLFFRILWLGLVSIVCGLAGVFVQRRVVQLAQRLRAHQQQAEAQREEQAAVATAACETTDRLLQNLPAAVLVLDIGDDFLIRSANGRAESMSGADRHQNGLSGRRLGDAFAGLDFLLSEPLRRAARGESVTLPDTEYRGLSGRDTSWTFSLTPQRDPQTRRVVQIIVIAAETPVRIFSLREWERLRTQGLDAALGVLNEGVVLVDATGRLVTVSRAAQDLAGQAGGAGESLEDWFTRAGLCYPSGQPVPPGDVPLTRALHTGAATEREVFLLSTGSAPRAIELSSAPVRSSDPDDAGSIVGAVAVLRDVTELRQCRRQVDVARAHIGTLVQISRRLNSARSEGEIFTIITEGALALLPPAQARGARTLLYGRDDETRLTLRATSPEEKPKRPRTRRQSEALVCPFDVQSPLLWEIYVQRLPVVSGDIGADDRFAAPSARLLLQGHAPAPPDVRSVLLLPLAAGSTVSGHLALTSPEPGAFDAPPLRDVLTSLASLATMACANARLDSQTRRRAEELDALSALGQTVVTAPHPQDWADTLTERVRAVFGADLCTLSLWETSPEGERRLRRQGRQCEEELLPEGEGRPQTVCDLCDDVPRQAAGRGEVATRFGIKNPPFGGCHWRAFSGQSGTHSVIAAPVRRADRVLGALTVYCPGDGPFSPEQIKLFQTLAALAAVQSAQSFTPHSRPQEDDTAG